MKKWLQITLAAMIFMSWLPYKLCSGTKINNTRDNKPNFSLYDLIRFIFVRERNLEVLHLSTGAWADNLMHFQS